MKLDEIKKKLNNGIYEDWIEFVNTYDFNDNYDEYYKEYILNSNYEDEYYISGIIDLAHYLRFYDKQIIEKISKYLLGDYGFFVDDSALIYYRDAREYFKNERIIDILNLYSDKLQKQVFTNKTVLKLDLYSSYACYYCFCKNKELETKFFLLYINTLKRCRKWEPIFRAYRDVNNVLCMGTIKKRVVEIIKNKNKLYQLNIEVI